MARALVTCSTSGLGLEFAWQLAGTGHDLVLVARDEDRLRAVRAQIRDAHDVDIEVLAADIGEREGLDRVALRLTDPVDRVDLLVNNAAYGLRGGLLEIDVAAHEHQMDTVMRSVLVLSHAAARTMVQRRRGAIINVSSLLGARAGGPYAAAKTWVTVFTESLAEELEGTPVTATVLLPGYVRADGHDGAARHADGAPRVTWLQAPFVVERALKDAARGEVVSIPSLATRALGARDTAGLPGGPASTWKRWTGERLLRRARQRASRRHLHAHWGREPD